MRLLEIIARVYRGRFYTLWFEYCLSTGWAFTFLLSVIFWGVGKVVPLPEAIAVGSLMPPAFTGLLLAVVCLVQFAVSIMIDRRYERGLWKTLFWTVWYPLVFWLVSLFTTLVSFPKVLFRQHQKRARWVSPDRGIKAPAKEVNP